jgi:signal transduction histidine kinase
MSTHDPWRLRIGVISADPEFIDVCKAAAGTLLQTVCETIPPTSFSNSHQWDVYVWDYQHNETVASVLIKSEPARILIVAGSADFSTLREILSHHHVSLLLPPATASSMRPFLEHASMTARREMSVRSASSTEQDWTMQHLLEANLVLQRTNQQQTSVLAHTVHDLHGPLIALEGYCDLLGLNDCGALSGQQSEIIRNMQRSLKRLCVTVFTLEMSLCGETVIDVVSSDRGLEPYVDQVIDDVLPTIEEKRIRLSVQLDPAQGTLHFNSSQIQHVFLNLFENACRSTPRDGTIEVLGYTSEPSNESAETEESEPRCYRIDIRDSGPRIPVRLLPWIFKELPGGNESNGRNMGGLGLASCYMILTAHRGRLWADSDAIGATFSFSIPYQDSRAGDAGSHATEPFLKRTHA